MQKSGRLDRIEKRLTPKQPAQAYISIIPPGRHGKGWLVGDNPKPFTTEYKAIDAAHLATSPAKPVILLIDDRCL